MTYEEYIDELTGQVAAIKATDENGIVYFIPLDEDNIQYRAYLTTL